LLLIACGARQGNPAADDVESDMSAIIPAPLSVQRRSGHYQLAVNAMVAAPTDVVLQSAIDWFIDLVNEQTGVALHRANASAAAIQLSLLDTAELKRQFAAQELPADRDSYILSVTGDGVRLVAADPDGLFYGLTTLWQLLTDARSANRELQFQTIFDTPSFEWRGVMLDSARHMQSPAFIKRYIDWMALHKLNVLHWHLTDDQGWRLEIQKYPRLTSVAAWRVPAGDAAAANIDATTGKPRQYGGYYSQEEVRDIVAHAASRFVTIVPEIDVPGHASAAIAAYPELGVAGNSVDRVPASKILSRRMASTYFSASGPPAIAGGVSKLQGDVVFIVITKRKFRIISLSFLKAIEMICVVLFLKQFLAVFFFLKG
jgi:hexosaminidase